MATIKDSIDVNVPVSAAYRQWSHFEDFPKFMEGIEEVRQYDPKHIHWRAKIAGKREEWDAEVSDNIPDRKIAWHSVAGVKNNGKVEFQPITPTTTRVNVEMDYEPRGMIERIGDMLGMDKRRVHKDLKNFKHYVEHRPS